MTENLTPRCERCRFWQQVAGREHGMCNKPKKAQYTLPDDFCGAFTPVVPRGRD